MSQLPEGRYSLERDHYRGRFENLALSRRNWMLAACAFFVLNLGQLGERVANRPRIYPYLLSIDTLHGTTQHHGVLEPIEVDEGVVQHLMREWVQNARSVVVDPTHQKAVTAKAYAFVRGEGRDELDSFLTNPETNPAARRRVESVHVTIERQPLRVEGRTWQVSWREDSDDVRRSGVDRITTTRWTAFLTVSEDKPSFHPERRALNPFGVYIEAINWSRTRGTSERSAS